MADQRDGNHPSIIPHVVDDPVVPYPLAVAMLVAGQLDGAGWPWGLSEGVYGGRYAPLDAAVQLLELALGVRRELDDVRHEELQAMLGLDVFPPKDAFFFGLSKRGIGLQTIEGILQDTSDGSALRQDILHSLSLVLGERAAQEVFGFIDEANDRLERFGSIRFWDGDGNQEESPLHVEQ